MKIKILLNPKLILGDGLAKIRGNLIYSLLRSNIKKRCNPDSKISITMVKNNFYLRFPGPCLWRIGDFWVGVKHNLITAPLSAALKQITQI
jgi:hypothetical protein